MNTRGVGRNFSRGGGVVLNVDFQKGYFCTDMTPNTDMAPKKGGSSDPSDPTYAPEH